MNTTSRLEQQMRKGRMNMERNSVEGGIVAAATAAVVVVVVVVVVV
jgi:hypothetical protein